MTSLLLMFCVVLLALYILSQLMDEPATEPDLRTARCPHCDARIRPNRRACPACGEKLV